MAGGRVDFGRALLSGLIVLTTSSPTLWAAEGTVLTRDGVEHAGEVGFAEGGFVLAQPGTEPLEIALSDIRRLTIQPSTATLAAAGILAQGWERFDYGPAGAQGFSGQGKGSFLLKTLSAGGHFIHRRTSLPGELVARMDRMHPASRAGLKVQRGPLGAPASLFLTADGSVHFVTPRDASQEADTFATAPGTASLPCWLKLTRSEKALEAFHSSDGQNWEPVGESSSRGWWRRGNSGDDEDDEDDEDGGGQPILAGLFVESDGEPVSAEFSQVRLRGLGLLAEYFADRNFEKHLLTRSGEGLRPEWSEGAPIPELRGLDEFSIRWTGELVPKETGPHREFLVGADLRAALWINGALVAADDWPGFDRRDVTLDLEAGKPYPIRIDYSFQGEAHASHHLSILMKRPGHDEDDPIPFEMLRHEIRGEHATGPARPLAGLVLADGSFLAGRLVKADATTITLATTEQAEQHVARKHVNRIRLNSVSSAVEFPAGQDGTGARMVDGDFLEGAFAGAADGRLQIDSLIFGPRTYPLEANAIAEIVLPPEGGGTTPAPGAVEEALFEVRTITGNHWRLIEAPQITPDGLRFRHARLGLQQVPAAAVIEITRVPRTARRLFQDQNS